MKGDGVETFTMGQEGVCSGTDQGGRNKGRLVKTIEATATKKSIMSRGLSLRMSKRVETAGKERGVFWGKRKRKGHPLWNLDL